MFGELTDKYFIYGFTVVFYCVFFLILILLRKLITMLCDPFTPDSFYVTSTWIVSWWAKQIQWLHVNQFMYLFILFVFNFTCGLAFHKEGNHFRWSWWRENHCLDQGPPISAPGELLSYSFHLKTDDKYIFLHI